MLSFLYRAATDLGAPVIALYLRRRRSLGREDAARFSERLGEASRARPMGKLVWCHAASVGEAASLLALIEKLRVTYPDTHILMTTGTVTSARLMESRLPAEVIHQYVPVDRAPYVAKFLAHWQPDLALWVPRARLGAGDSRRLRSVPDANRGRARAFRGAGRAAGALHRQSEIRGGALAGR
jgi:3-deoxy-D-manno-octulosonic-acid transferase